ncbi:ribonuclease P protein subunit RPR2, putative [Plasmodium malariae]|uniref:Ribonuclease P protein subunit RPR2, putative n=1 Tax=Plasmodium malariae TaxID=5858 RepID=A0A1C3L0T6_PLAMA|nr:ribonuclease P protein subunit RPR2, putative [Plasmodium malariae]
MLNSENENEFTITKSHLLKNKDRCDVLKRKLNNVSFIKNCPNNVFKDNSENLKNGTVKKHEHVQEYNNSECFNEDINSDVQAKNNSSKNKETNEKIQIYDELSVSEPNRRNRKKRKKKGNNNDEAAKPMKQMIRINYLLQASFLMNHFSPNISREYIKTMRRLSNKFLIKYDKKFKKLFCKKCNSVLIPSVTCKVSVNPLIYIYIYIYILCKILNTFPQEINRKF